MPPHVYWLTGLPASGKTTLARALHAHIADTLHLPVTCLDGDELRQGLCSDLGLDNASRTENIRRAGEVARLMHRAGLTVICAFVSPFDADRQRVRQLFAAPHFSEVHLATSLEECIRRDPKGLYRKAQRGEIQGMTGWDAPFEPPTAAEFVFDTQQLTLPQMVNALTQRLQD